VAKAQDKNKPKAESDEAEAPAKKVTKKSKKA
jgi:hypothetical protein